MSELNTSRLTMIANALAALGGPAHGNLHFGEAEMLARIHTLLGSTVSHLTTHRDDILAGIRNQIVGGAPLSAKTSSETAILADIAGLSRLTHSAGALWDRAMAVIGAAGGGGGGDWVPESAKFHFDFVGDRAWVDGVGEVALATLLGSDANTETGWGPTAYDAGNLTADGYWAGGSRADVALLGAAKDLVLAGVTFVMAIKQVDDTAGPAAGLILMSANGVDAIEFDMFPQATRRGVIDSWNGSMIAEILDIVNFMPGGGALNRGAGTISGTRDELSVNSSNPVTDVIGETDRPPGNPLVAVMFYALHAVQSLTLYDPLPSTAGLSDLSATGVTNTAPTAISGTWFSNGGNTGSGTSGTYQQDLVSNPDWGDGLPFGLLSNLVVADAEGNPCVITMVDDDSGLFAYASGQAQLLADFPDTNPHAFTLRATDPGGLYVEQEFTITVTPGG